MPEFLRNAIVIAGNDQGLKIEGLRVSFTVSRSIISQPNQLQMTIYNLSRETQVRFEKEFTKVFLFAGYVDNTRLLFKGNIRNVAIASNGVETMTTVYGGDADQAFLTSTFAETFQGKTPLVNVVRRLADTFEDVTIGKLDGLQNKNLPLRAYTLVGKTAKQLDTLSNSFDFIWQINDGVFTTLDSKKTGNNRAIVVSAATGLLEVPTITEVGVNIKTLLNPLYVPQHLIDLQTSDNQIQSQIATYTHLPRTKTKGLHKIAKVTHVGDTHSNSWTSTIECLFPLEDFRT